MSERQYQTPPRSDRQTLLAFSEIAREMGAPAANITVDVGQGGGNPQSSSGPVNSIADQLSDALADDSFLFHRFTIGFQPAGALSLTRQPGLDLVAVTFNDQQPDSLRSARFVRVAQTHFPPIDRAGLVEKIIGPELAQFYQKREEALLRLEQLTQTLIEQNEAYRRKLDDEKIQFQKQTNEAAAQQRTALEADYQKKRADLDGLEAALAERNRQLDDRDSRHARRDLRQELLNQITDYEKNFSLSDSTKKKRVPIHISAIVLMLGLFAAVAYTTWQGFSLTNGAVNWVNIGKGAFSTVALVSIIVFYIRWNDHWFERHAREEFRLKRLSLDIDRASWIVEMALEWKREQEAGEIPPEFMQALTRNLFEQGPEVEAPRH